VLRALYRRLPRYLSPFSGPKAGELFEGVLLARHRHGPSCSPRRRRTPSSSRTDTLAGPDQQRVHNVAVVPKAGFETELTARTADPFVRVRALDADGAVLGTSLAVKLAE
jgi:hypothetical protein